MLEKQSLKLGLYLTPPPSVLSDTPTSERSLLRLEANPGSSQKTENLHFPVKLHSNFNLTKLKLAH